MTERGSRPIDPAALIPILAKKGPTVVVLLTYLCPIALISRDAKPILE